MTVVVTAGKTNGCGVGVGGTMTLNRYWGESQGGGVRILLTHAGSEPLQYCRCVHMRMETKSWVYRKKEIGGRRCGEEAGEACSSQQSLVVCKKQGERANTQAEVGLLLLPPDTELQAYLEWWLGPLHIHS